MTVVREETVTTALITMLATAVGVGFGDHGTNAPDGTAIDTTGKYGIVYRIEGGNVAGSLGDGHQDVTLVYQVSCIGRSRQEAEGLARLVVAAMTDVAAAGGHTNALAGTGWTAGMRERRGTGTPRTEGTDETGRQVWVQRERFNVTVHPA